MLVSLTIQNYALIRDVDIAFHRGMTVLLGETGAGKSVIVDALGAALGSRLSASVIRSGSTKAVVEAEFDSEAGRACTDVLRRHDLEWDQESLLVRREISTSGTSRCYVNGIPTQVSTLREIASLLIDFHGQHDTHGLLSPARHREIFDDICQLNGLVADVAAAYSNWVNARTRVDEAIRNRERASAKQWQLQRVIDDVSKVSPQPDEDRSIADELRKAEAAEYIINRVVRVREILTEDSRSVRSELQHACSALEELCQFSPSLEPYLHELRGAIVACTEASLEVSRLADPETFSSVRLQSLRERWLDLQRIIKNYGSLEEAITQAEEARKRLEDLDSSEERIAILASAELQSKSELLRLSRELSAKRRAATDSVDTEIASVIRRMGMKHAHFATSIEDSDLSKHGIDSVSFRVATNSGTEPQGLHKIASGGELSRVMLALKRLSTSSRGIGTLVLDEIDTGISGRVARSVGLVMEEIAQTSQIICITHLPQIASLADAFLKVTKHDDGSSSYITVTALPTTDAHREIAALISGEQVTEATLQTARELMSKHPATTQ
jgi:DNA repair protein RecN (Recombination protein N)